MKNKRILYIIDKENLFGNMCSCSVQTSDGISNYIFSTFEANSYPSMNEYYEKIASTELVKELIKSAMISLKGLQRCKLLWDEVEKLGWTMRSPGVFVMDFNLTTPCELEIFLEGESKTGNLWLIKNKSLKFFGFINNIQELKNLMKKHGLLEIML